MEAKDSEKTSTDDGHSSQGLNPTDDGRSSNGLNPTSGDSGISNNEDFSLVSGGGTSDFSLLETSDTKESKEDEPSQTAAEDNKAIHKEFNKSNSTENISRHNGVEDTQTTENISEVKDKTRRESTHSRTSSVNDFSILDAADIEEESDGKIIADYLKISPFSQSENKDHRLSSTGHLISMNRPTDSNGHERSELGSSFAVLEAPISSSYPSSFDKEIDRTKIHILPPKNSIDAHISTSVDKDGQKIEKKKTMQGGIVEVDVHREDWKTNGKPNSIDTTDNEAQEGGNRGESKGVKVQSKLNSHPQVDPTLQKTYDSNALKNKDTQNAPDTTNVENIDNNSDMNKAEAVGESLIAENELLDRVMENGNLKEKQKTVEEIESQVSQQKIEVASNASKQGSTDDESDFSVVEEPVDTTSKISRHFGKSDIDSDIPSSHYTGPRSRSSTSSESIEINMSEPELSDDSNGHNEQKASSYSGTETSTGSNGHYVSKLSSDLESEQSGVSGKPVGTNKPNADKRYRNNPTEKDSFSERHKQEQEAELLYNSKDQNTMDKSFDNCSIPFKDEREKEIENEKPEENVADYNGINHALDLSKVTMDEKEGNIKSSSLNTKKTDEFSLVQSDVDEDGERNSQTHPGNCEATGTSTEHDTESNTKEGTEQGKKTYDGTVTELSFVKVDMPETDDKCGRPDESIKENGKEEMHFDKEKLAVKSKNERFGVDVENIGPMCDDVLGKRGSVSGDSYGSGSSAGSSSPDVWQPSGAEKYSAEEAAVYESLRRTHGMKLSRNYQCSSKHKSHETQFEILEIPVKDDLVSAKWRYVLSREEKLTTILKEHFPDTKFNYDESFERIELIKYEMTKTVDEAHQWSKNVMNVIENQVRKISSYLICCSEEDLEMIMLQMETFHSSHNLDICIEHSLHPGSKTDRLIVIGQPTEVASVILQLDPDIVKIYEAEENSVVLINHLNIPLDDVQHDVFNRFKGPMSIMTKFPNIYTELRGKSKQILIQAKDEKIFSSFITENWLKFKHRTKIHMKPQEFTLLCKTSVKDYIVNDKLNTLGFDYKWSFEPDDGDIILFTENLGQLDEIRDAIFGSFTEYRIHLLTDPSVGDVRKMEKWTEKVDDVINQSKGMADMTINDMQTCVTIIGTDDLMEAWIKFGYFTSMEKYIDENIKSISKASPALLDEQKLVKKFVQIDSDRLEGFDKQTMDEIHNIANNLKVDLVHTDRGFEVKGLDDSKVKNMCDHLLEFNTRDHDRQNREAVIKRFVVMDVAHVDNVCQQKVQCMVKASKELNIEYDPTNLGFEVKGTTEASVKKFCDYLLELNNEVIRDERELSDNGNTLDVETEVKQVKRFVQMKEEEIDHLCNHKLTDLNNFGKELNVSFDPTNLGFEVKGKTEENVKRFCDYLLESKNQIHNQDGVNSSSETTKKTIVDETTHHTTEDSTAPPSNMVKTFTQLDERVILYIERFQMVEIEEVATNLEVTFTSGKLGFEIHGEKRANVQSLHEYLINLNSLIEIKKVDNVPKMSNEDVQRIEEKYKCMIQTLMDKSKDSIPLDEVDAADFAVWCINDTKLSVAVRDTESLTCDIIVIPVEDKTKETEKKIVFQEKINLDEVQLFAPMWVDNTGKEKHELTNLLTELLIEINNKEFSVVALPLSNFNSWPASSLTKIIMESLKDFCHDVKPTQCKIQRLTLYSNDKAECEKAASVIEDTLTGLEGAGLNVETIKKPDTDLLMKYNACSRESSTETQTEPVLQREITDKPSDLPETVEPKPQTQEQEIPIEPQQSTNYSFVLPSTAEPPQEFSIQPEVIVIKGVIAQQEVDAIVNSTSGDFELNNGAVSKSILEAAGYGIQKEVRKYVKGTKAGGVIVTGGYKLKCKSVFHGALEGFDKRQRLYEQRSVKILKDFIKECLMQAHKRNYTTIAFPVLGAGALDFPPDVVATMMSEVTGEFRKKCIGTKLSQIKVVVYRDEGIYTVFKKVVEAYRNALLKDLGLPTKQELPESRAPQVSEKPLPVPVVDKKPPSEMTLPVEHIPEKTLIEHPPAPKDVRDLFQDMPTQGLRINLGQINLSAKLGDVTKLTGFDCLILLWPQEEITATPLDKENILKSVGPTSFKKWETEKSSLSDSKVLVTPGGSLPQKTIIHVYVENSELKEAFMLGLTKADEMRMLNVVIPVRTTDQLAQNVQRFSTCIYRAVADMRKKINTIREIRVCIGGKHLCQPILATLAKLQETGGTEFETNRETCNVEITALKDDMETIIADICPNVVDQEDVKFIEEEEIKNKTLTKEDVLQVSNLSKQYLLNVTAEISPDVIQTLRNKGQLDSMKKELEGLSGQVKVIEKEGKWIIHGSSFSHIEICQKCLQDFFEKVMATEPSESITGPIYVKVDLTRDLFDALLFLEKRKLSQIIGIAAINFKQDSKCIEIIGDALPVNTEAQIQKLISNFQSSMVMDAVVIQYRQVQESSPRNFLTKLQTEHPDVYVYSDEGKGAESSFSVYLISMNRDDLASAKTGIQTEFLRSSKRTGRFSQSQSTSNSKYDNSQRFGRSISVQNRIPTRKTYKTAEGLIIHVYMGSILKLDVDCIVNAANSHLMHGGGIAAVIADAAGKAFNKESYDYVKSNGEVKTGTCCVTKAGNLPYKHVIHGVGPHWSKKKAAECSDLLQKTIEQCIQTANAHHMTSVAIPSISAGLYGMPVELCTESYAVGVITVSANRTGRWSLKEVHFVDNKPEMVFMVQKAFSDFFESSEIRRQRSVEERLQTSVEQFKGDTTIIDKLNKNKSLTNAEEIIQSKPTEKINSKTESINLTINKSPVDSYILPRSSDLPASWKVAINTNLIEIETGSNLKVYIYEGDFGKQIMESIAVGQDIEYGKKSHIVQSLRGRVNVKANLDQLKLQLPKPTVGTVAMFEANTDIYTQKYFVVFTPQYQKQGTPDEDKRFHDNLYGCYLKIFQEVANTKDTEFLAVSFLKTGNRGTSFEEGVKVFLHAVNTFTTSKNPASRLKQIHLIVNRTTSALTSIKKVLDYNFKDRGHLIHIDEKADKQILKMVGCKKTSDTPLKEEMPSDDKNLVKESENKGDKPEEKSQPDDCAICLEELQDDTKKTLQKCKHVFCKGCIDECFRHRPVCPTCGMVYGIVIGTQPTGTMKVEQRPQLHLQGHKQGCWVITYNFYSGKQTAEHQNPGKPYRGTSRTAYLPSDEKGTMVMKLLKIAFDRKLVFTIGHSRTTGEENVVTWNDIHHKTSVGGGPQAFGYPDPEYLDRVLDELAVKGVTKEDLRD